MREAGMIWCPFADEASARTTLSRLLDERLVACGNIVPGLVSLFVWEGTRDEGRECGVLFKTAAGSLDAAIARLEQLHPYDRPAIAGWTARVTEGTFAWLEAETGGA